MFGPPPRYEQRDGWMRPAHSATIDTVRPPPPPPPRPRWWGHHEKNTARPPSRPKERQPLQSWDVVDRHRKLDLHPPRAMRVGSWQPDADWRPVALARRHEPAWQGAPRRPVTRGAPQVNPKTSKHARQHVAWYDDDPRLGHQVDDNDSDHEDPPQPRPRQSTSRARRSPSISRAKADRRQPRAISPMPRGSNKQPPARAKTPLTGQPRPVHQRRPPSESPPHLTPACRPRAGAVAEPTRRAQPASTKGASSALRVDNVELAQWQARLPEGWKALQAPNSRIYFWNTKTGTVTWEPPCLAPLPPTPPPDKKADASKSMHVDQAQPSVESPAVNCNESTVLPEGGKVTCEVARVGTLSRTERPSAPISDARKVKKGESPPRATGSPTTELQPRMNLSPSLTANLPPAGLPTRKGAVAWAASRSAKARHHPGSALPGPIVSTHPEWMEQSERERLAEASAARRREEAASAWECAQHRWIEKEGERARREAEEEARELAIIEAARRSSEECRRLVAEKRRREVEAADAKAREVALRVWSENQALARRNRAQLLGEEVLDVDTFSDSAGEALDDGHSALQELEPPQQVATGVVGAAPFERVAEADSRDIPEGLVHPASFFAATQGNSDWDKTTRSKVPVLSPPTDSLPPRRPAEAWSVDFNRLEVEEPPHRKPKAAPTSVNRRKRPSSPTITVVAPDWPPRSGMASSNANMPDQIHSGGSQQDSILRGLEKSASELHDVPSTPEDLGPDAFNLHADELGWESGYLEGEQPAWVKSPAGNVATLAERACGACSSADSFNMPAQGQYIDFPIKPDAAEPSTSSNASVLDAVDRFLAGDMAHHFMSSETQVAGEAETLANHFTMRP